MYSEFRKFWLVRAVSGIQTIVPLIKLLSRKNQRRLMGKAPFELASKEE